MTFKNFILVILFFICLDGFPGGVDVGNGGIFRQHLLMIDEGFSVEAELATFLKKNSLIIESGRYSDLADVIYKNGCDRRVQIDEMEVETFYPVSEGRILPKEYRGRLTVNLRNCSGK